MDQLKYTGDVSYFLPFFFFLSEDPCAWKKIRLFIGRFNLLMNRWHPWSYSHKDTKASSERIHMKTCPNRGRGSDWLCGCGSDRRSALDRWNQSRWACRALRRRGCGNCGCRSIAHIPPAYHQSTPVRLCAKCARVGKIEKQETALTRARLETYIRRQYSRQRNSCAHRNGCGKDGRI